MTDRLESVIYPSVEKIIEYNLLAISLIKAKKGDKAQVLSKERLASLLEECKTLNGDVYDKAVFLLASLIRKHPFASGNRRTAFIVTKAFLIENGVSFNVKDDPSQARVMTGIREGYYSNEEIKEWIQHGKIREFKR
ncbi:TPA: type II toxin-antitoxin system death-on-curing family toxin [Candidatus Micrarchaeota archaeon]|nr:type II toxin-antitoxin system death-on-curing family toxin [Candidatus Micrarchaeota archaeon]